MENNEELIFSKRLKKLRKENNLSQKDLGAILCYSQNAIGNWEQGIREPNLLCLKKIAQTFNCTIDYLLGLTD